MNLSKVSLSILSLVFVFTFCCNFKSIQSSQTNSTTPPWHNGQIPYVIDSNVTAAQHCLIHSAMYHIAWRSCVRFSEKSSNDSISAHYLQIQVTQTQNQCMSLDLSSSNGGTKSVIRLSPECFQLQTIVYLLVHTLGIGATQNNLQFSSTRTTTELTKQETESMNRLYSCSSLVKLQMGFIKQFVKHREQCSSSMNRKSKIVQAREPVKVQNFSIYLLTYNVDEKNAPSDNLSDLFNFDLLGSNHDIYVIALQDLSALTLITRDTWMHAFDSTLWVKGYAKLERKRNMYTTLSIYVKKEKLSEFNNNFESINFGGRRGGSAIRLKYKEVSFAFVGAHFTGGSEEQRIKDYHSIIESVKFNGDRDGILEQDYAFFMGVLNSRFENLTRIQLYDSLVQNPSLNSSFDGILRFDQLNKQRREQIAFSEFQEPEVKFAPTYKFVPGTNDYNWKKTSPAYTDRILYRNKLISKMRDQANRVKVAMQLSNYNSLNQFVGSDRKPVRAIVHIPMTAFELVKQKQLKQQSP